LRLGDVEQSEIRLRDVAPEEELAARGEKRSRQDLLTEILRRDELDSKRTVAPLRAASDAILVETDGLSVGEALDRVLQVTRS